MKNPNTTLYLPSNRTLILISYLIITLFYLPYLFFGENSHIRIHDNLDSNIAWVKILVNNNLLFKNPNFIIHGIFDGIPISSVYPYYDLPLIIFKIFGMYWGYVINRYLISLIGFYGMYLLLKRHILKKDNIPIISIFSALIFSLLPFWSFSASVLGIPFAFYAFLNIRKKETKITDWLIILVFGFYSSMILSGVFLLIVLAIIFIYDLFKQHQFNIIFFSSLLFLVAVYTISHFPIIVSFLSKTITHRHEFYIESNNIADSYVLFKKIIYNGQFHAHSTHYFIFFPIIAILILFKGINKKASVIITFIILTSILYGAKDYYYVKPIFELLTSVIPLQFQRFHFLHPMLWYILLAITITTISRKYKKALYPSLFLLFTQLIIVTSNHELITNYNKPSFKEFYATSTFSKIKQTINCDIKSYKVISIGLHPAIAQYNELQTLDGYFTNYPLKYKHKFRAIIKDELNRDSDLKNYFDNWGSRCYAFSSEIGSDFENLKNNKIDTLNFNYTALKNLGGKYIISVIKINTNINKRLTLIGHPLYFRKNKNIYIYRVD